MQRFYGVFLAFCEPGVKGDIKRESFARVAVLSRIIDRLKLPGDSYKVTFQGLRRVEIVDIDDELSYYRARVDELEERIGELQAAEEAGRLWEGIRPAVTLLAALGEWTDAERWKNTYSIFS